VKTQQLATLDAFQWWRRQIGTHLRCFLPLIYLLITAQLAPGDLSDVGLGDDDPIRYRSYHDACWQLYDMLMYAIGGSRDMRRFLNNVVDGHGMDVWHAILAETARRTSQNQYRLRNRFHRLAMRPNENPATYGGRVKGCVDQLADIGVEYDDALVVQVFLNGLTGAFRAMRRSLCVSPTPASASWNSCATSSTRSASSSLPVRSTRTTRARSGCRRRRHTNEK